MTDHDSDDEPQDWARQASPHGPWPWLKPLLLFAVALVCGLLASGLWIRLHPQPVVAAATAAPSDTPVMLDPDHHPLPVPMAGGSTNLPPPASPAADAPHIVSAVPDAAASPAPDSTSVDAAASPSETMQGTTPPPASEPAAVSSDSDPQVLDRSPPLYPVDALRDHAEGTVRVKISIDAQGNVVDAHVSQGSGTNSLDRAAVDAVRTWRYKPAMHGGEPVPDTIEVPVDFRLDPQTQGM